ncbi:hypothetical protein WICPIJ_005364 [Wickerhamomyces pijperi]|uniref:Uncharacterized protein n=1 Tax=Wickerhamomyces pijperi TaxID=599730 RepID=A0A9P8Q658_WICPI|nr:hypothetical protein WICPIJ_005364 [Wickerhamomyces pijperi]
MIWPESDLTDMSPIHESSRLTFRHITLRNTNFTITSSEVKAQSEGYLSVLKEYINHSKFKYFEWLKNIPGRSALKQDSVEIPKQLIKAVEDIYNPSRLKLCSELDSSEANIGQPCRLEQNSSSDEVYIQG